MSERVDPFAAFGDGEKTPSVSWKDAAPGTTINMHVTEWPEQVQTTNYETGEPEFWPPKNGETQGNPKMAVVITGTVDGETRALWVRRYPQLLWDAVVGAQKAAGALIEPGGRLAVTYTGDLANPDKPRMNPSRMFAAHYTPKDAFEGVAAPPPEKWGPAPKPATPPPPPSTVPTPPGPAMQAPDPRAIQATIKPYLDAGWTVAQLAALPAGQVPGFPILAPSGEPLTIAALQAIASLPV